MFEVSILEIQIHARLTILEIMIHARLTILGLEGGEGRLRIIGLTVGVSPPSPPPKHPPSPLTPLPPLPTVQ